MTLGKNYRIFRLLTGEMIITEVTETNDEGNYLLSYPATIVPTQQTNQIGFGRMMPFSDFKEDMIMNPSCIAVDSTPVKGLLTAYEEWIKQVKSQESGIIIPTAAMPNVNIPNAMPSKGGQKIDFSKLNTGR